MSRALVIGNGESRKSINLDKFNATHTVIGCNAIHRDYKVDHLICCDRRMADEAVKNANIGDTKIYVRDSWYHYFRKILKNKNIFRLPDIPVTGELKKDKPDHWGSGCYAILLAAHLGHLEIDLIGFDLYSINDRINNVYKGTQNYSKSDSQAIDYAYWVYQTAQVFKAFPNRKFSVYNMPNWNMPIDWKLPNIELKNIHSLGIDL